MPPLALTQRAYAWAMAGIPGILVALVPSGAQVITVTGSLEPPVVPGSTPQPVSREAPAATAVVHAINEVTVLEGRGMEERRLPVMGMHISASRVTAK
ncbi:hypothetical protein GCM10014713_32530 [Streptomyces purpureus]|uniref:Uncharacterized protein n=1 Tax=Streptomyces purpureus TaxID=1951 RepID=A0A918LQN4_9ACTN|nr:hypothetical protein GCM10014713_32530 [Streptomyces purpureus]